MENARCKCAKGRKPAKAKASCEKGAPAGTGYGGVAPAIDWSKAGITAIDERYGHAVLPAEWGDPEDEGLYDDLAR